VFLLSDKNAGEASPKETNRCRKRNPYPMIPRLPQLISPMSLVIVLAAKGGEVPRLQMELNSDALSKTVQKKVREGKK